jgi:hypothetical protein
MPIVNSILSWIMKKRIHQMELFQKFPMDVQQEVFRNLIEEAKFTEWGKKFEYKSIRTIEDFQKRVPLQNYDTLKPFINRIMEGEQNILWPSDITWFAKSSGTTSDKSKFIPVSSESLEDCHFKGGKDMLSIYCNNNPDTQLFSGKNLVMGGSHNVHQLNSECFYGDLSAVLIKNLPIWVEMQRTPDLEIALMDNWEEKIVKMAEITSKEDVTNISGVPTWTIVLAKKILEITGKSNLIEVWPNLELYIHGAVNFEPYKKQFAELFPSDKMNYLETYNASEGFFAIQDTSASDLLLMLDYGIFFEFIPLEEIDKEDPKVFVLDEIELEKNYALVISTNAGLWRYVIGDTIKFTSKNPYRLKITGRTKHFINAFGEELIIDNAENALVIACQETNARIKDYTAGPIYFDGDEAGGHEWIIEFEQEPNDFQRFSEILDKSLCSLNSDYEAKRKGNMALMFPTIHIAQKNTFFNWLKAKDKIGGQHKVPRLANNRTYLEEILPLLKESAV